MSATSRSSSARPLGGFLWWTYVARGHDKLVARTGGTAGGRDRCKHDDERGSVVSPCSLFQDEFVQRQARHGSPQPFVLLLETLELPELVGSHDAAFGLEAVARSYGLEFQPVIEEDFALLVDRKAWFDAPMQKLMAFCATEQFVTRAESYGPLEAKDVGSVIWNA